MPISSQLLKPVGMGYILFTLMLGFLFDLIPWDNGAIHLLPDGVLLMLFYWGLNQPRRIGVGFGFWLGIAMDVADGNVFGQHALAYVVTMYLVTSRQRRMHILPLWQQALYVGGLLLIAQTLMVIARMALGDAFIGWGYFVSVVLGGLMWIPLTHLLLIRQQMDKPAEL